MKNRIYLIALVLVGCLMSCESESDDTIYQNELEKSLAALSKFKKKTNNTYKYTVVGTSWIGVFWETTIVVTHGKVTQRKYKCGNIEGYQNSIPKENAEWTENKNQIGSHAYGFEPLTLDEVYAKAAQEWMPKREDVQTYFEIENDGLISTCGYEISGCADDCFIGIRIKSIQALGSLF